MKPLRILSIVERPPQDYTGCEYHRQHIPHSDLGRNYPCDIVQIPTIYFAQNLNLEEGEVTVPELIESCDIVHFGRLIDSSKPEEMFKERKEFRVKEVADYVHSFGKPIIFDIDDYWNLSSKHALKEVFRQNNQNEAIRQSLQHADHVTVTTDFLKEKALALNRNVTVLPNAIDPDEDQWKKKDNPDKYGRLRFGWVGGSCHEEDFEIMYDSVSKLWHDSDCKNQFQIILAGYNVNDKIINYYPDGHSETKGVPGAFCMYTKFERMLTDDYRALQDKPNYLDYLAQYTPEASETDWIKAMPYMRNWSVDTFSYGQRYNNWDVTYCPLNDNTFNNSKSQLKMIESGFMGKACIVSGVMPYTIDAKHMVNAMVVPPNKNHKLWNKYMRMMIHDRALVKELATNLENEMRAKYHIAVVNKERWKLFCTVAGRQELISEKRKLVA